jgi:hypothetical protein
MVLPASHPNIPGHWQCGLSFSSIGGFPYWCEFKIKIIEEKSKIF